MDCDLNNKAQKGNSQLHILYVGLLMVFILEYIRPGAYFPFIAALKFGTIIPILVFVCSVIKKVDSSDFIVRDSWSNSNWLLFLLFLLILSLFTSDDISLSKNIFTTCLGYTFIYYIIRKNINTLWHLRGVFLVLICCHIFLICVNFEILSDPSTRSYIKNSTFLGDGNDFSLSLVVVVPFCIYLVNTEVRVFRKIIYLLMVVMLVLTVIGTSSRGGSLGLFCGFFYLGLKSKSKIKWGLSMVLLACLVIVYAPPQYFNRLQHINNPQESSANARVTAWKVAIKMAMDNPISGIGAGHFPMKYASEKYRHDTFTGARTAHSMYFLALGELGFPGLLCILGFVLTNIIQNEKVIQKMTINKNNAVNLLGYDSVLIYLNASFISFSISAAFLSVLYYPHIFVLAGLLEAGRSIVETKNNYCSLKGAPESGRN